jgi:methionyl aminopeptidase
MHMPTVDRESVLSSASEKEGMRAAGRFNAQLMDFVRQHVQPGVTLKQLDRLVLEYTRDHGHKPACMGYRGYPACICASVNDVVCHGIPNEYRLKDGDIVNIDLTTIVKGWFGDSSETFLVGNVSPEARRLVQVAFDALYVGIDAVRPLGRVIDIGRAIQRYAHSHGYSVVRQYQGHGIGAKFHLDPGIPHFPEPSAAKKLLVPGICFTIEPMINAGTWKTAVDKRDGWTVRTTDGKLSAQFEHTVLLTEQGPEILTLTQHGPQRGHRFY